MDDASGGLVTISNMAAIRDGEPRTYLLRAEAEMADQRWADALKSIVNAYNAARPRIGDLMYHSRHTNGALPDEPPTRTLVEFSHSYSMPPAIIEATKRIEEQGRAIHQLRDNMAQIEELLALLSVGISLPDYWRFKAVVPDHPTPDTDWGLLRPGMPLTREHVAAAFNFVVTALQRWQGLDTLRDEVLRMQSSVGQAQS